MLTQHPSFERPATAASTATADPKATNRPTTDRRRPAAGRVLQLVDADAPGVGRHVVDLTRHLARQGWEVDVAYVASGVERDFPDRLAGLDIGVKEVLRLEPGRRVRSSRRRTLRSLRRLIRRRDHHIVHGHGLRGGTWSQLVAANTAARTVHTPNPLADRWPDLGPTRRSAARHLDAGLSPLTDHLIHLSEAEAHHSERLGLLPVSWSVIPAGVDPVATPSRREARAQLGLPAHQRADDPLTIGWVGELDADSDLPLALHAHLRLGRHSPRPAELVVVGDGPRSRDLAALALRLGDQPGSPGAVRFVGEHDAMLAIAAFDVALLPSDRGGFPYLALEALWAGVPSVSAPNPTAVQLLAGVGHVTTDRHPDALAAALATVSDRARHPACSTRARRRAEHFTNARVAEEIADIYRRLLPSDVGESSLVREPSMEPSPSS